MFRRTLILAACLLASAAFSRADDQRHLPPLRAIATTDSTEVHPDGVFEVTLALENPADVVQSIRIPDCGWDRVWRSSNHHVTWDFWDCDSNDQITIDIAPHETYTFPKPLKMFVEGSMKASHVDFKMGFKAKTFGKIVWSDPITLDVTP